jgi:hypothetical protein
MVALVLYYTVPEQHCNNAVTYFICLYSYDTFHSYGGSGLTSVVNFVLEYA